MSKRSFFLCFLGFLVFFVFLSPLASVKPAVSDFSSSISETSLNYSELVDAVNVSALEEHVKYLSRDMFLEYGIQPTRAAGYVGNNLTAEYIHDFFVENGLTNVSYQEFPLVDCIDYGANITVEGSETLTLYPILPNLVCPSTTPPEGISGRIVYVGSGTIEELDGHPLNGSLVLVDWNSRNRWITAAKYGAKAVIFLPPREGLLESNYLMSEEAYIYEKYLPRTPYNFPRFYVNGTDADVLLNHLDEEGRIVSTQRWKNVTTRNVIGYVEGENPNVIVVVSSYYDSYSVAPSFAPGAQEATGLAALLEIAKYTAKPENKPKNTVLFVAFSGHSRFCQGSYVFFRDYRSWHAVGGPYEAIGDKMFYNINLDLSTGTNTAFLAVLEGTTHAACKWGSKVQQGSYYGSGSTWQGSASILQRIVGGLTSAEPSGKSFEVALDSHLTGLGYVEAYYGQYQSWKDFPYDHAWALTSYVGSFTVTAAYDARPFYCSPFDTFKRVNFENLETLAQIANVVVNGFVNENSEELKNAFNEIGGRKQPTLNNEVIQWVWAPELQIGYWITQKAFYGEVSDAIFVALQSQGGSNLASGMVMDYDGGRLTYQKIIFSDEEGYVWEDPACQLTGPSIYWGYQPNHPSTISAWKINETDGNLVMAPDLGEHMYAKPSALDDVLNPSPLGVGFLVVFNCSTVVVFDEPPTALGGSSVVMLNLFSEHTSLREQGNWGDLGVRVLTVPPDTRFEYIWKMGFDRYPRYLLNNASEGNPLGAGYSVKPGEQLTVHVTALSVAETFFWMNEERFNTLLMVNPAILRSPEYMLQKKAGFLIQEAKDSLERYDYSTAESCSFQALYLGKTTYDYLRANIEDASYTVPYLAFMFVPFVFLAERTIFAWKGAKRAISIILTFAFLMLAFSFFHPGFVLASSSLSVVLGASILIMSLPLIVIVAYYFRDYIRALRYARMGKHETGVTALTGLDNAFLTGTEHIRRYRLRSTLTLVSIIILVASLVNFTSISAIRTVTSRPVAGTASFEGLYIHKDTWARGDVEIPDYILTTIKQLVGDEGTVVPRAWRYNLFKIYEPVASRKVGFRITHGNDSVRVKALWGLVPEDFEVMDYLVAGRWFLPEDRGVTILSEEQAETLLGVNATTFDPSEQYSINMDGMYYKVLGIVNMNLEQAESLDWERITPLKMDWPPGVPNTYGTHLPLEDIIIMPYEVVVELGGSTASISVGSENQTLIKQLSNWMVTYIPEIPFQFLTFFSISGQVYAMSHSFEVTSFGLENQLIPMALVCLSVLNIMVGSVYERKKSIFTYSTVGLNPLQISFMFLAESVVYAVLGGVTGFLLAISMGRMADVLIPGMVVLNYASRWVLISVGSALLITLASSLFPAVMSSRLVTPSLERVWKMPTKPVGDRWEIPLPFRFASEAEAKGFTRFLQEYNVDHGAVDSPDFSARDVQVTSGEIQQKPYWCVSANVRLFPYDMGIEETSSFYIIKGEKGVWECRFIIERIAGLRNLWIRHNYPYATRIREQLLLWGSLREKAKYMQN